MRSDLLHPRSCVQAEFEAKTLYHLGDKVLTEPLKMHVVNIVGGCGEEDTVAVEMKADAVCRNGEFSFFRPPFQTYLSFGAWRWS